MTDQAIDALSLPDCKMLASGKPRPSQILTRRNLAFVLDYMEVTLQFDIQHYTLVYHYKGELVPSGGQASVYHAICDVLNKLDINNLGRMDELLAIIAKMDSFHPMQVMIESKEWDQVDRFEALLESLPVTDEVLRRIFVRKYLIQVVQGACGWSEPEPESLPHALVLSGAQGCGKTRWLASLAPGFVLSEAELHLNGMGAKDHQLQVLQWPIVELAEIDSTFRKSDVSAMKAFLSRPLDVLRAPYARVAESRTRKTSFCGSVNDVEFLTDDTGSRRYWPLEVVGVTNPEHGIDMQQMWAQAQSWWLAGESYFLDGAELALHTEGVKHYNTTTPEGSMVADHIRDHEAAWDYYGLLSVTQIATLCGIRNLNPVVFRKLGHWLKENLGPSRKLKGEQRVWAFPVGASGTVYLDRITFLSETEAKKYARWSVMDDDEV